MDDYAVFVDSTNEQTGNQYISLWTCKAKTKDEAIFLITERAKDIYRDTKVVIDNVTAFKLDLGQPTHYYGTI